MTSEHYASGMWLVAAGNEEAFVDRWREWLTTSSSGVEGFAGAHLLRSNDDPRRFVSFSWWNDAGARDAWKKSRGFDEGFAACRGFCDDFQGGDFTEVVQV